MEYLTKKREERIYKFITEKFVSKFGDYTHCETKYVTENLNYYEMYDEQGVRYDVHFKTNGKRLLKRTLKFLIEGNEV